MSHLTDAQIELQLQELNGWAREGDAIVKTFVFTDFVEAISFMMQAAFHAEEIEHHPEWKNQYNKVHVSLTTHDSSGGITSNDIRLAKKMDIIAQSKAS